MLGDEGAGGGGGESDHTSVQWSYSSTPTQGSLYIYLKRVRDVLEFHILATALVLFGVLIVQYLRYSTHCTVLRVQYSW
jgi:hypothetical protein